MSRDFEERSAPSGDSAVRKRAIQHIHWNILLLLLNGIRIDLDVAFMVAITKIPLTIC